MKKLLIALLAIMLCVGVSWAEDHKCSGGACVDDEAVMKAPEESKYIPCRGKGYKDWVRVEWKDCYDCHIMTNKGWVVKEFDERAGIRLPASNLWVENGKAYVLMSGMVDSDWAETVDDVLRYAVNHGWSDVTFEIHSPGGGLLEAWRVVGIFNTYRGRVNIHTRCSGFAASAAFVILVSGDIGRRSASATAELMHHELWTMKFLAIDSPSKLENEADVLRHLQDTVNVWVASRCKLSKQELDDMIRHKDFWVTGKRAAEHGFVDMVYGDGIIEKDLKE